MHKAHSLGFIFARGGNILLNEDQTKEIIMEKKPTFKQVCSTIVKITLAGMLMCASLSVLLTCVNVLF